MKVAIIGCGLIGIKRALALGKEDSLVACCDTNPDSAKKFDKDFDCKYFLNYRSLLNEIDFDVAIVAVVNKYAKEIIIDSLKHGKHVIAEKPLGRNLEESKEILSAIPSFSLSNSPNPDAPNSPSPRVSKSPDHRSVSKFLLLKTGFNHRFHPAVWKAKQMADEGKIGKIFSIRARYGHGGRPGMEKEWRASKDLCGGGELLDQGVHIIDLIRWFGGDVTEVYGKIETQFWNIKVEDNAYAILKTVRNVTVSFHVSWTNWKNIFSFEIFGTDGYLSINGLGGSYGPETLEYGRRNEKGGIPEIQMFDFPLKDFSWKEEWKEFKSAILEKREVIGNGIDGMKANQVIEAIYLSNQESKVIHI